MLDSVSREPFLLTPHDMVQAPAQVSAGPGSFEVFQLMAQGWEDTEAPSHSFRRSLAQQVAQLGLSPGPHLPLLCFQPY